MNDSDMDKAFHALANTVRRHILDVVMARPGLQVGELCEHFEMSRIGVLKHLGVLETAGLITSEKDGRARRLYFNAVPIQLIYDRWSTAYSRFWTGQLADWKYKLEEEHAEHG